jgi:hypothetical protein
MFESAVAASRMGWPAFGAGRSEFRQRWQNWHTLQPNEARHDDIKTGGHYNFLGLTNLTAIDSYIRFLGATVPTFSTFRMGGLAPRAAETDFNAFAVSFDSTLLAKQERLGKDFEQVLFDNLWDLYAR